MNFNKPIREERKGITDVGDARRPRADRVGGVPIADVDDADAEARDDRRGDGAGVLPRHASPSRRTGDTFLDTRGWGKGTVVVNGHHLGRFWSIGPQQTLYVPGPWLRKGANDIVVFTLDTPTKTTMTGLASPILNEMVP